MAFCSKCGAQLADDAAFCMQCGTPANKPNTKYNTEHSAAGPAVSAVCGAGSAAFTRSRHQRKQGNGCTFVHRYSFSHSAVCGKKFTLCAFSRKTGRDIVCAVFVIYNRSMDYHFNLECGVTACILLFLQRSKPDCIGCFGNFRYMRSGFSGAYDYRYCKCGSGQIQGTARYRQMEFCKQIH